MSPEELRRIIQRGESPTLDFKSQPYAFFGTTDACKEGLLKDVLAMANTSRKGPARILIGVADKGSTIVGLPPGDKFDDSHLQNLLSTDRLSRRITARYFTVKIEEKFVGVIEVDVPAKRPIFLRREYCRVGANAVWTRRGSTNAIADPDEIIEMAKEDEETPRPVLVAAIANPGTGEVYLGGATIRVTHFLLPDRGTPERQSIEAHVRSQFMFSPMWDWELQRRVNELFAQWQTQGRRISFSLAIANLGGVSAGDVRLTFTLPGGEAFKEVQFAPSEAPDKAGSVQTDCTFAVRPLNGGFQLSARIPKLRPKEDRVLEGVVSALACQNGQFPVRIDIRSDDLPAGATSELILTITGESRWLAFDAPKP